MMAKECLVLLAALAACAMSQRASYAGNRPIGYPVVRASTAAPAAGDLGLRLSDADVTTTTKTTTSATTTTQRLPIEANGDRDLFNRLRKLPVDNQPFWIINWQALEANRNNPQTYPDKTSQFGLSFNPYLVQTNPGRTVVNSRSSGVEIDDDDEDYESFRRRKRNANTDGKKLTGDARNDFYADCGKQEKISEMCWLVLLGESTDFLKELVDEVRETADNNSKSSNETTENVNKFENNGTDIIPALSSEIVNNRTKRDTENNNDEGTSAASHPSKCAESDDLCVLDEFSALLGQLSKELQKARDALDQKNGTETSETTKTSANENNRGNPTSNLIVGKMDKLRKRRNVDTKTKTGESTVKTTSTYPSDSERENFKKWFEGVANAAKNIQDKIKEMQQTLEETDIEKRI